MYVYMYIVYMCVYIYVCVCVCVCVFLHGWLNYVQFYIIVLDWSDEGCSLKSSNVENITCQFYHLTNFAILFYAEDIDATHDKFLSIVTYIGVSLSLAGTLLTLLSHIIFP